MKNIWNDPRSLFNGNHLSSIYIYRNSRLNRPERPDLRVSRSLRSLANNARKEHVRCVMHNKSYFHKILLLKSA